MNPELLDILICPISREPLEYDAETHYLVSRKAGVRYPIRQGIPILLVDEAEKIR